MLIILLVTVFVIVILFIFLVIIIIIFYVFVYVSGSLVQHYIIFIYSFIYYIISCDYFTQQGCIKAIHTNVFM